MSTASISTRAPYGMYYNGAAYFGGGAPPGFDGHQNDSVNFVSDLSSIQSLGARCCMRVSGGESFYRDSNSAFSLAMWKNRIDLAAARTNQAQMNAFAASGALIAHDLCDDLGPGGVFPGGVPTFSEIDEMARYSKSYWSAVPTFVRIDNVYLKSIVTRSQYSYLDFGWIQWHIKYGAALAWYQNNASAGRAVGIGAMGGFNLLNGGSGITAPWNTHPNGGTQFGMSPQEIDAVGEAFSAVTNMIGLIGWSHKNSAGDASYYLSTSINTALTNAFSTAIGRVMGPINWRGDMPNSSSGTTAGSTNTVSGKWGVLFTGGSYRHNPTAGQNTAVPLPSGINVGDLINVHMYSRDNSLQSCKVPSGWSEAARVSGNSQQGGEVTILYRTAQGNEGSTLHVYWNGPGGTTGSCMGTSFVASGGTTGAAGVLLAGVGSGSSWAAKSDMGPVKGGFTSAISDALILIVAGKTKGFNNGQPPPAATMSATTSGGETWNRMYIFENGSGDDSGLFCDYTFTSGLPSITTKSWSQLTKASPSLTSGSGSAIMLAFAPLSIVSGQPPALPDIANFVLSVGSTLLLNLTSAGSTPITYSISSGPSNATMSSTTGAFQWTGGSAGSYVFGVQASNAFGLDSGQFNVQVSQPSGGANAAPVITNPGDQSVMAQDRLSFSLVATDADNDPIVYSLDAGSPAGAFMDSNTGQFLWTPTGEQGPGVYGIVAVAFDGQVESRSTFTVTVTDTRWTRVGGPSVQLNRTNPTGNKFRRI